MYNSASSCDDEELRTLNNQVEPRSVEDILRSLLEIENFCNRKRNAVNQVDYSRKIRDPLLLILRDVGETCTKFGGKAKKLAQLRYLYTIEYRIGVNDFLDVAIRDIVGSTDYGLSALRVVLEGLQVVLAESKDPSSFIEPHLENLCLFRLLAGFYYDRKALSKLIGMSESIPKCGPFDRIAKSAMLMFVQVAGEYFDRLLPLTLIFAQDISATAPTALKRLRSKLSHLSVSELKDLLDNPARTELFTKVRSEIEHLRKSLQRSYDEYETICELECLYRWPQLKDKHGTPFEDLSKSLQPSRDTGKLDPPDHWPQLQDPHWTPFEDLLKSLQPSRDTCNAGDPSIKNEYPWLLSPNFPVFQKYLNQRKSLMSVLHDGMRGKSTFLDFQKTLQQEAGSPQPTVSATTFKLTGDGWTKLIDKLTKLEKDKEKSYQNGKSDEGREIEKELENEKNTFINNALRVSREEHDKREQLVTNMKKTNVKIVALLRSIKPCNGYGNIPKKHQEFLKKLRSAGAIINKEDEDFSWTSEPNSDLEKLFHSVYKTGISTKSDKDVLRCEKINRILLAVDDLREMFKIKTTLDFREKQEACKNDLQKILQHIFGMKPLSEHRGKLLKTEEELLLTDTVSDMLTVLCKANDALDDILKLLKQMSVDTGSLVEDIRSLKTKLEITADETYSDELPGRVKMNHRNHLSVLPTTKKIHQHFKKYLERLRTTSDEYARNMNAALRSLNNGHPEERQLETAYSKYLGLSEQLKSKESAKDAQKLIVEAELAVDEFEQVFQSVNSNQNNRGTGPSNSMRANGGKTLSGIFQDYQVSFLASQFFVANIYEMLKEICDFPELTVEEYRVFGATDQIRNHYFHSDPFDEKPLAVHDGKNVDGNRCRTLDGELAKEISILSVAVKFILNDLADGLRPK